MSTPTRPVNIGSPRAYPSQHLDGSPASGSPNIRVLRAQYGTPPIPNIPPRNPVNWSDNNISSTPLTSSEHRPSTTGTPVTSGIRLQTPGTPASGSGGQDHFDDLTDEEKAKVLRRHLVSREERENQLDRKSSSASFCDHRDEGPSKRSSDNIPQGIPQKEDSEPFPIPYHTPGADLTHDIYRWQTEQRRQARPRAASFAGSSGAPNPAFANIHEPGGFRRNYLLMRANEQGEDDPPMPSNFIEFLYLFGHFAGEDLEEIEEDDEEAAQDREDLMPATLTDAEASLGASITFDRDLAKPINYDERTPLISSSSVVKDRSRSRQRRKRAGSVGPHGDATVVQAVLMLLKAFVGTGILFLGKAFYNGGILFSACLLVFIALISLYSFLLLVKTKFVVSGSFGDIGGALYGPYMRYAILTSIAVSQIGFVAAYIIFVSENLRAFVMAITNCTSIIPVQYFILAQLVIILPFALVRNLAKLSTTALVADAFILAGLIYIFGSEFFLMKENGVAHVELFNPKDFPLLVGTAVFSFEGIGLVIPITDAMKEPRRFPAVLTGVMLVLAVLFAGGGVMSYLTFGENVQTVVIVNLDAENKLVQVVQFLYSIAIMLSVPLQLFPAIRIMENGLFTRSGKVDMYVKWQKNVFRFFIVAVCTAISWVGAKDLDKFVSFVGSFACVPLCYVYPAMLHYKACARTKREKFADIALMLFGTIAAIYTTTQTVRLMMEPEGEAPRYGRCDV